MPRRTTYAHLTATAALVIGLAGGGAAVAGGLARNSVGSPHIKAGAVRTADLAKGSVGSAQVKDGQITGADVDETSLGPVPRASNAERADRAVMADRVGNILVAAVDPNGNLLDQSRFTTSAVRLNRGSYEVTFDRPVGDCAAVASLDKHEIGSVPKGNVSTALRSTDDRALFVTTTDTIGVDTSDLPFTVVVFC